jgi:hypothetical protein
MRNDCYAMRTFPNLFFLPSIECYFRVQNLYNTQVSRGAETDTSHAFHNCLFAPGICALFYQHKRVGKGGGTDISVTLRDRLRE